MRIGNIGIHKLQKLGVAALALGLGVGVAAAADKKGEHAEHLKQVEKQHDAAAELEAVMGEKGKLLVNDDFTGSSLDPAWKKLKGKWELTDGALKGVELKSDNHPAVIRRDLNAKDLIAQFSFKFDGGKQTSFSLNNEKGHVCRVVIKPDGFTLMKDADKKAGTKGVMLASRKVDIKPGEWHTMLVEVVGNEMLASLDGGKGKEHLAFGSNPAVNVPKTNFGFPASGEGVSFRNVKVWEASPKKDWDERKKQLAGK